MTSGLAPPTRSVAPSRPPPFNASPTRGLDIKDKGGLRPQFCHVIDIVPTIYEAAGIKPPVMMDGTKQKPLDGVSLVYTFANRNARLGTRSSILRCSEIARSTRTAGWPALRRCDCPGSRPDLNPTRTISSGELYNVGEDFSQANHLAEKNPAKLKELQAAFDVEAKKYNVYPLDSSFAERADPAIRPSLTRGRQEFTYYPGMVRIPKDPHRTSRTSRGQSRPRWQFRPTAPVASSPPWAAATADGVCC